MAINHIEIKDFLVFKDTFTADFCSGINVLIGGNATGKTTLMKLMYWYAKFSKHTDWEKNPESRNKFVGIEHVFGVSSDQIAFHEQPRIECDDGRVVFIPEKDILEHAKGILPFIEEKQTGFNWIYRDVLIRALDIPTMNQIDMQKKIAEKIASITGGHVEWVQSEGTYYTVHTDGMRIPFALEASGYKKLGFLGLLVACRQLDPGSVLFWDEPENSVNPELVPTLIDILLELSKNGVQVIIATHNYYIARYFDIRKDKDIPVVFHNLSKKEDGQIINISSTEYIKLANNLLETASRNLTKSVIFEAMEEQDDEQDS